MKLNMLHETGDLLDAPKDQIIAHGCNTVGAFGAGVAGQIARRMPTVAEQYKEHAPFLLGAAQLVYYGPTNRYVFNLMTQLKPGRDARPSAITTAFTNMAEKIHKHHELPRLVAIPRIGCGIGGLTWQEVEPAIVAGVNGSSIDYLTVIVYDLPTR